MKVQNIIIQKRCQASIEFMLAAGLMLILLLGVLFISGEIRDSIRLSEINQGLVNDCQRIVTTINAASYAGPGSAFSERISKNFIVYTDKRIIKVWEVIDEENFSANCMIPPLNVTNGYATSFIVPANTYVWAVNNNYKIELREAALYEGLILWLPFNKNTSLVTTQDNSVWNRNAQIGASIDCNNNGYLLTAKPLDKSCGWNSVASSINISNYTGFNSLSDFTISAWVYKRSDATMNIIGRYNNSDSNQFIVFSPATNRIQLTLANPSGLISAGTTFSSLNTNAGKIVKNKWNHIVITKEDSAVKIYLNGTDVTDPANAAASSIYASSLDQIQIGSVSGDFTSIYGNIDDVRVYNRSLSATEVQYLYWSYFNVSLSRLYGVPS